MNLKITSCQARNTFPLMRLLPGYLGRHLHMELTYEFNVPWQVLSRQLYAGEIHVGWICSKPYALQLDASPRLFEGIAVPVTEGVLYESKPVYYAYLVVHRDHPAQSILDLENGRVAYNEPGSQSGYFSLISALTDLGTGPDFFVEWVESGGHEQSLKLLQKRAVDCAAIDSTLWDYEVSLDRDRFSNLKVIGTLGPFPAPPLVAHTSVPADLRKRLIRLLTNMHLDSEGRTILKASQISRFEPLSDALYRQLL